MGIKLKLTYDQCGEAKGFRSLAQALAEGWTVVHKQHPWPTVLCPKCVEKQEKKVAVGA